MSETWRLGDLETGRSASGILSSPRLQVFGQVRYHVSSIRPRRGGGDAAVADAGSGADVHHGDDMLQVGLLVAADDHRLPARIVGLRLPQLAEQFVGRNLSSAQHNAAIAINVDEN